MGSGINRLRMYSKRIWRRLCRELTVCDYGRLTPGTKLATSTYIEWKMKTPSKNTNLKLI
jgi:hypothetical protein